MSASLTYHRLTSYGQEHSWRPGETAARTARPAPFKQYDELPTVVLPTDLPCPRLTTAEALSGVTPPGRRSYWTLAELAFLLRHSVGLVGDRWAAGSIAGAAPLETYVVAPPGHADLPDGIWHHDPAGRLRRVAEPPSDGPPYLVITGVPWRRAWKHAERGWRHLWWDCGNAVAHLVVLARSMGLPLRVRVNFSDRAVTRLVGADETHEMPLVLVTLGTKPAVLSAPGHPATGWLDPPTRRLPLILAAQRGSRSVGPDWPDTGPPDAPALATPPVDTAIGDAVASRVIATAFDSRQGMPIGGLRWAMAAATLPIPWDAGRATLTHHLAVHGGGEPAPGSYQWFGQGLRQRAGDDDARDATRHFCLGDRRAGDASVVVVHCADLPATVDRFGERGYRAAHLEAGIAQGRLHLAAHVLGHAAAGLTVNDSLAPAFLRTDVSALLATALGCDMAHNGG